jgi:hypothetical protein
MDPWGTFGTIRDDSWSWSNVPVEKRRRVKYEPTVVRNHKGKVGIAAGNLILNTKSVTLKCNIAGVTFNSAGGTRSAGGRGADGANLLWNTQKYP